MKLEEYNKCPSENIRKLMKSNTKTNEKKRLTRKEKEELKEELVKKLYEQGYTYREIAKKLRISVRDISRILKGEERKDEIDEIKERLSKLEKKIEEIERDVSYCLDEIEYLTGRLNNASYMIRHALGNAGIKIRCPKCHEWTYLELREIKVGKTTEKRWVCSNCNQVPF
jgi:transposase